MNASLKEAAENSASCESEMSFIKLLRDWRHVQKHNLPLQTVPQKEGVCMKILCIVVCLVLTLFERLCDDETGCVAIAENKRVLK